MSTWREKWDVELWEQEQLRSHPLLHCESVARLPSTDKILALANLNKEGAIIVLPLETEESAIQSFIETFANDEVRVWDNSEQGRRKWIRVQRTLTTSIVLGNADAFVEAAQEFRRVATQRIERLAEHFGVTSLAISSLRFQSVFDSQGLKVERVGHYDQNWRYAFHGFQCAFTHQKTEQHLDVELGYGDDFGVLDPWFFANFLETTPEFQPLYQLLPDDYNDTRKVMQILEKENRLIRVPGFSDFWCQAREPGLAAPRL